jgi:hypothetical protein
MPYVRLDTPTAVGQPYRIPRPSEIVGVLDWATQAAQAYGAAREAVDVDATLGAQSELVQAAAYIIMRCWADPATELQARKLYDDLAFSAKGGRRAAGRLAADELYDDGWPEPAIIEAGMALYREGLALLQGLPAATEVDEAAATFRG